MAYIRTSRNPMRARPPQFVPGSLACAALRPFALSRLVQRLGTPTSLAQAGERQVVPALSEVIAPLAGSQP